MTLEIVRLWVTVPGSVHWAYQDDTLALIVLQVLVEILVIVEVAEHEGGVLRDGADLHLVNVL